MKLRILTVTLAAGLLPLPALADACGDQINALRAEYRAGDKAAILSAVSNLRRSQACNPTAERMALAQTSGVLAQRAQALVAADNLAGAEAMLEGAPGLHWALQAVRGDIAAKRGNRSEAAALYNSALDTITDPSLTPSDARLIPAAERITKLAQENMMLAGTLEATVTRGGTPTGVMRSAMRGIAIEAVGHEANAGYNQDVPAKDPAYVEPAKDPVYVEPVKEPVYAEPVKKDPVYVEPVKKDPIYAEAPKADVYKPAVDPYAGHAKADYAVADGAAKAVHAVFLPIRFAFGSADLDASGRHEAETVANFLLANKVRRFTVVGHTDEVGSDAFNLDLSFRRAASVRHFLEARGVYADIHIDGKGESEPPKFADPYLYNVEERRAIARRVELVLQG